MSDLQHPLLPAAGADLGDFSSSFGGKGGSSDYAQPDADKPAEPLQVSSDHPPVGLMSGPIGNVALGQPGSAVFPSRAWQGQDWLGLTRQVARGLGTAQAELGTVDDYGRPVSAPEPTIDAEAANKNYGIPGHLKFAAPLPDSVAKSMYDAKRDELGRQDAAARTPAGFFPNAQRMGAGFVAGLLDPVSDAAMFVPPIGEARLAGMLGRGLAGTVGQGAAAGVQAMIPLTALRYGLSQQEQSDYSGMDALADVAMGGATGAALHLLGAGVKAGFRAVRGRPSPQAPGLPGADPATAEAAHRTAVAQMASGAPVEVSPVLAAGGAMEDTEALRGQWLADQAGLGEPDIASVPGEGPVSKALPYERVPKEPDRLLNFLRRDFVVGGSNVDAKLMPGGMRDAAGDLRAILGGVKGRPGLINDATGMTLDNAALRAFEEGYFPHLDQRPEISELLDAIREDHSGSPPRYAHKDLDAVLEHEAALAHNSEIDRLATEHDIDTRGKTRGQFFDALAEHMSAGEARMFHDEMAAAHDDAWGEYGTDHAEPGYGAAGGRTLEEMENEHRQADTALAARPRDEDAARPGYNPGTEGAGEAGGGDGGRDAELPGRAGAEADEGAGEPGRTDPGIAFDQATAIAHGGMTAEEAELNAAVEAALDAMKPDTDEGLPAALDDQTNDALDSLATMDAAGLMTDADRADVVAAKSWLQQAADYGKGIVQASSCIMRGGNT